jgi:hypothetical protein
VRAARAPGFDDLAGRLGTLFTVPPTVLYLATFVFPLVLGFGAALLGGLVRRADAVSR